MLAMDKTRYHLLPSDIPTPLRLETLGYNPEQEEIIRTGGYPRFHWLHTQEGCGLLRYRGVETRLEENMGSLLLPGEAHHYVREGKCWKTWYLTFDGALAAEILSSLGLHHSAVFYFKDAKALSDMMLGIMDLFSNSDDTGSVESSVAVYRFLLHIRQETSSDGTDSIAATQERLKPLLAWLETECEDPGLGMDQLAERLHVSTRHLNSLFRKALGYSPHAYVLALRIRKAMSYLLERPEEPVKSLAANVGFHDASHFIKTFRKFYGCTPEQFRRMNGR